MLTRYCLAAAENEPHKVHLGVRMAVSGGHRKAILAELKQREQAVAELRDMTGEMNQVAAAFPSPNFKVRGSYQAIFRHVASLLASPPKITNLLRRLQLTSAS